MFHAVHGIEPIKPTWSEKFKRMMQRRWHRTFSHRTWSQFGEDRCLHQLFKAKDDGFYVDVGAFDPEKFSNTHALHRRGWRGVNIDMSPTKIGVFECERPGDINVIAPISDADEEIEVYVFSQRPVSDTLSSALDTLDKTTADHWQQTFNLPYETKTMRAIRLDDLLKQVKAPDRIDFMNIDVEGAEMSVLRSLSFETHAIDVIAIEIHARFDELSQSEPYRYLSEHGYQIEAWLAPTAIMRQRDTA